MDSVLVVSGTPASLETISACVNVHPFRRIAAVQSSIEARACLSQDDFDLIIIDSPLTDEYGDKFALYAADTTCAGIILITPDGGLTDMNSLTEDAGVFVMPKPLNPEFFYQAVKLLAAARKRVMRLQSENEKLQNKIQEVRLIDRAKCILIQYLKMTEPQAHRYIEKQAMDLRQSRTVIAENILRTYER